MSDASSAPRLPTRCPACKGAIIERMARSSHGTFIWFHCLFCNHHWKFRLEEPNPNGELTGTVFVVTKGGKKYKLGSVVVSAIPEDVLKKHLKSKALQVEIEAQELHREIDRLTTTLKTAQAEDQRLWKILQGDENNSQKAVAWSVAYNQAKNLAKQIEDLQARRQHLASGEYFYDGLPPGTATAKTDAGGKFTLVIPRRDRFGVVARASRELLKGKESYFWFVWASLDGEPSRRLTLSNGNILGAGSPDSALQ
jgi:hypothetical protein